MSTALIPLPRPPNVLSDDPVLGMIAGPALGHEAWLIDPAIGVDRVRRATGLGPAAVVASPNGGAALLAALAQHGAWPIRDPREDESDLRNFVNLHCKSLPPAAAPDAPPSGVVLGPNFPARLSRITPFSARVRFDVRPSRSGLVLPLQFDRLDATFEVEADIADARAAIGGTEYEVRFSRIPAEAQRELQRICKAAALAESIRDIAQRVEAEERGGFRRATDDEIGDVLSRVARHEPTVTFGLMHAGRCLIGKARAVDQSRRQIFVAVPPDAEVSSTSVAWSTAAGHESLTATATVVERRAGMLVLSVGQAVALTDRRSDRRVALARGSMSIRVDNETRAVLDVSANGLAFVTDTPLQGAVQIEGPGHYDAFVRSCRPCDDGFIVGASFTPGAATATPIQTREFREPRPIRYSTTASQSELVEFDSRGRNISGLWNEVEHPGERTVFVIPPAWGKTKETSTRLAQFLAASYGANQHHTAILRFDYSNSLGGSYKDPNARSAGREAVSIELSRCVEDLHAAVRFAAERSRATRIVLIGMSFSGPVTLRVAVDNPLVTHLVALNGASDIQDLVRMASGGVDYVARYRAGIRAKLQNVLGVMTDADRWCADGVRTRLLFLSDTQRDASRLDKPVLWIHGEHDGFVSRARIVSVLEHAPSTDKQLAIVPFGHLPSNSTSAIQAFAPIVSFLLGDDAQLATPPESVVTTASAREWAAAPRAEITSPAEYWRNYMLGDGPETLGYDVLAMTEEYGQLMRCQVDLLDAESGWMIHDVGGGMGHSLRFLPRGADAVVYDFLDGALGKAKERGRRLGIAVATKLFDGSTDPLPTSLVGARRVLLSLFLSALPNPKRFLRALRGAIAPNAIVVASSVLPDADLSTVFTRVLQQIEAEALEPPPGWPKAALADAVRDYIGSAALLLRLAEEGNIRLYEPRDLKRLFEDCDFEVTSIRTSMGSPSRAVVLSATPSRKRSL